MLRRHLELFAKIFRIKVKIREKKEENDVRTRREERAKNMIRIDFLCLIYSFPIFLIVICMDPQNMMYYLLIMN